MKKIESLSLSWLTLTWFVSMSLFLLTWPRIEIGIWPRTEWINIAFLGCASAFGFGLLAYATTNPARVHRALIHPLVICPFMIGVVSFIFSFFTRFPLRSWYGAPELGEGVFWYLGLSLTTASILILKQKKSIRLCIALYALFIPLLITWLSYYGEQYGLWKPYYFNDYLAFFGLFSIPIVLYFLNIKHKGLLALCILLGIAPIVFSGNKAAEIYLLFAPLLALILWGVHKIWCLPRKTVCTLMATLPFAIILGEVIFAKHFTTGELFGMEVESIWSRYILIYSAQLSLQDASWLEWLFGRGWGSFTDIAATYIPLDQTKLFAFGSQASDKQYWDRLSHGDFHSHSQGIEALVSIGLVGALLILIYLITPLMITPRKKLPIACLIVFGLILIQATWFQFTLTLPWMILGLVACCSIRVPNALSPQWLKTKQAHFILLGLVGITTLFILGGSLKSYDLAKRSTHFAPPKLSEVATKPNHTELLGDRRWDGHRLAYVYHQINTFLVHTQQPWITGWDDKFAWLRKTVDHYLDEGTGQRLKIVDLLSRGEWAFTQRAEKHSPEVQKLLKDWEYRLLIFLEQAPKRTDLAAPYLIWQMNEGNEHKVAKLATQLYNKNPQDPVGLWFLGLTELKEDRTLHQGKAHLKAALENGIQDIIPIEKQTMSQIMRS